VERWAALGSQRRRRHLQDVLRTIRRLSPLRWVGERFPTHLTFARQRTRWVAVMLVAAAVLVACSSGEVNVAPEAAADSTGFRGGVRTGIGMSLAGVPAEGYGRIAVTTAGPIDGTAVWTVAVLEPTCDQFPANLSCPSPEETRLLFRASAVLDFRTPVEIDGATVAPVRHNGPGESTVKLPIHLPSLGKGRHCVLLALLEDEATVVDGQFPDHGSVALFVIDNNGDEPNHCNPRVGELPGTAFVPESGSMGRCGPPTLSGVPSDTPDAEGTVSATISLCGDSTTISFAHNGQLLGSDTPYPPFLTTGYTDQTVGLVGMLPDLPSGWWRVISVSVNPTGPSNALVSRPRWRD
jgi:hypothetical protein